MIELGTTISVTIRAPIEEVWSALTTPELIKRWFFGVDTETDWQVGSPLVHRGEWQGKPYEDKGTVLSFEQVRSLSFDYWSSFSGLPDRPELRQIVRYDLADSAEGVRVSIQQSNVDTQERADHSAENWRGVLAGMKKLLEGAGARDGRSGVADSSG